MAPLTRSISFNGSQTADLGQTHDGFTGRWIIQVTAISGATIVPQLSADGTTFNTRAVTPADNSADVTSITTTGLWIMDSLCGLARLSSSGGTATVLVLPAVG